MSGDLRISESKPGGAVSGNSEANLIDTLVQQLQGLGRPPAMTTRTLRRGQHLYWPGGLTKHMYAIKQGMLKTYRPGADGRECISGFHSAGKLLGLDTLAGSPMRCGALALDTCVIYQVQLTAMLEGAVTYGQLWHQVLEEFNNEIARLENQLSAYRLPAPTRLAAFILSMANCSGEAYLPMSHREIANYLRLVPETVSRLLTKFRQCGWLLIDGRAVIVRDRAALEQAAAR